MSTYNTNVFRAGLKIILDNEPYSILENEFVKPGKGQAFNRVKLRNLMTGRLLERTFKSGEVFPQAEIMEKHFQYLYEDGSTFHFMDTDNYEQIAVDAAVVNPVKAWLLPEVVCTVTLWERNPISVTPPTFMHLKIRDTDPGLKGDTAGTGGKSAELETGVMVRVPLFLQVGDEIKVDTRTGEYVSRVTKSSSRG